MTMRDTIKSAIRGTRPTVRFTAGVVVLPYGTPGAGLARFGYFRRRH
jgi:hypothetical protein